MRILQIGKFFPPYHFGGIETVSCNLYQGLIGRGIKTCFLGFLPLGIKHDISKDGNIYLCKTNIDIFSAQLSLSFIRIWKQIKDDYDIIILNLPHPFANLVINIFPPKISRIVLLWHSDIIRQRRLLFFYRIPLIKLINFSSVVVAPTKKHLDDSDFSKYFTNKECVIPYPLNIIAKRSSYVKENGKKIIFSCGRLIYYKGFEVLAEAAKYLSDEFVVHIAGDGPLYNKLLKRIKKYDLLDKVKLLGCLSDKQLAGEFRQCFVFCLPSVKRSEMFGVVQVEAFCYGKPVISTNIPRSGVSEVNKDGITGYVVEINNPQAIAEKVELLNNGVIYHELCNNALDRGKELTDPKIIDQYINLLYSL